MGKDWTIDSNTEHWVPVALRTWNCKHNGSRCFELVGEPVAVFPKLKNLERQYDVLPPLHAEYFNYALGLGIAGLFVLIGLGVFAVIGICERSQDIKGVRAWGCGSLGACS